MSDSIFVPGDNLYEYIPFCEDFGPVNLGQIYFFCNYLEGIMKNSSDKKVIVCSGFDNRKRTNVLFLISSYLLIMKGKTPEEAFLPLITAYPPLLPFRDVSPTISTYNLTVLDCLRAIGRAMLFRFFSYDTFDEKEYIHFEKLNNGDMNWIIPGRIMAFSSPSRHGTFQNWIETPDDYVPIFKRLNITAVIRLNDKIYDRTIFTNNGIKHFDLYFEDGGVPSETIIKRFLDILETEKGGVAVHCKAGLGRTGTCIALYLMKHYQLSAQEAIGWIRICRPGSVIGIQQHFLHDIQFKMWKLGELVFSENMQQVQKSNTISLSHHNSDASVSNFSGGPKSMKPKRRHTTVISAPTTISIVKTPKITPPSSATSRLPSAPSSSLTQGNLLMQQKTKAQQQANKIPQNGVQRPFLLGPSTSTSSQKNSLTLIPLSKSFSNVPQQNSILQAQITPKKMTKSLNALDWQHAIPPSNPLSKQPAVERSHSLKQR